MTIPIANYQEEQAQFNALLEPASARRILMYQGESGCGKTHLVEWCIEQVPTHMRYLSVQLRGSDTTAAHIFYRLGRSIGWDRLSTFNQHVASLVQKPVANDQAWSLEMRSHLDSLLQKSEPDVRKQHRATITDAWFADVATFRSPLFLFLDTYEQATTELDQWFSQQFLPWVADTSSVRVLVAGQKVPEQSSDWRHCCSYHELNGVDDAEAWLPIAQAMGRNVASLDYLAGACAAFKGNPSKILDFIRLLPEIDQPARPEQTMANKRARWRQNIVENFELLDIRELCFDFGIDYEGLGGSENVRDKVIALITYMEHRGRLVELIDRCRELRPRLEW